jgi:general secretion pathway protein J
MIPHPPSTKPRARPAFTLLEVMLAVVVFSIVLLAMHLVFHGALRLRNKTAAAVEAGVPLQQALAILERDLANLVPPGTLAGAIQSTPTLTTLQGQVSPYFFTTVGILRETTPWSDLQRVAYRLLEPTNNSAGRDLYRSVVRNPLPATQDDPEDQFLLHGVDELLFEYYDGTAWRPTWDATNEVSLMPAAIKLALYLTRDRTNGTLLREPVELVVPVTVQAFTNQTAQAASAEGGV